VRVLAGLAALAAAACTTSTPGTGGCQLTRQAQLPGTPLTLLPAARLDTVGDGFMLSGLADDGTLRWAAVDGSGVLGEGHSLPLIKAPWLTFTSDAQPGDTLLLVSAVSNGPDAELHVTPIPSAGVAVAPAAGPALVVVSGAAPLPLAALASTRTGSNAVLAWADPAASRVKVLGLSPKGQPLGPPGEVSGDSVVACMAFVPGKKDLTLAFYEYANANARIPVLMIAELLADGTVDSTLQIALDGHAASCPRLIATDAGYAFVFQDSQGSWLSTYHTGDNHTTTVPFAPALDFGGPAKQPSFGGLAMAGADLAVIFSRPSSAELWRVTEAGSRVGVLQFPSTAGNLGQVSTQLVRGGLVGTYADYMGGALGVGAGGGRVFLGAACL
jgi:hypothetical protein